MIAYSYTDAHPKDGHPSGYAFIFSVWSDDWTWDGRVEPVGSEEYHDTPWDALGISRRTWYRRQKEARKN